MRQLFVRLASGNDCLDIRDRRAQPGERERGKQPIRCKGSGAAPWAFNVPEVGRYERVVER